MFLFLMWSGGASLVMQALREHLCCAAIASPRNPFARTGSCQESRSDRNNAVGELSILSHCGCVCFYAKSTNVWLSWIPSKTYQNRETPEEKDTPWCFRARRSEPRRTWPRLTERRSGRTKRREGGSHKTRGRRRRQGNIKHVS